MANMILPPQIKDPADILLIPIDFTPDLPSGGSVSSAVVTSKNKLTGASTTGTLISGAATIASPFATQKVIAGTHGDQHVLNWKVTYSDTSEINYELVLVVHQGVI